MRSRYVWTVALALLAIAVIAGCGSKSADTIVKDLDKAVGKMESYEGSGTMILHTGQQPLEYKVEVWYQTPNYYRISLTNAKRDITQIVLRNDEGVFVLTPQLNKSYRFQSDWPDNQGQVYLYQTLVQSILLDNSRQFATDKDTYVFDVMAGNYQNGSFARQKIWLDQDNYAPRHVEVSDANANVMVEVTFNAFEFGKKFDKSAFDMDRNMGTPPSAQPSGNVDSGAENSAAPDDGSAGAESAEPENTGPGSEPSASPDGEEDTSGTPNGEDATSGAGEQPGATEQVGLKVVEPDPGALPIGVEMKDTTDVQLGEQMGVMLRYTGTYDFTLIETVSKPYKETMSEGIVLDLGFTVGHLTDNMSRTLTWTYEGVEYRLSSADLPDDDMVRIAQSMEQSSGK